MYIETRTGTIQMSIDRRIDKLWIIIQWNITQVKSKCTASKCKNIDKSYQHNAE